MRAAVILALVVGIAGGPVLADGALPKILTARDKQRLTAFDATRIAALAEARTGGSKEDLAVLDRVLGGKQQTFGQGFDMTGEWRCRTLKLGRSVSLAVYGWFKCRITDDGSGWRLEKTNGSQRTSGRFFNQSDTRLVYLGAMHMGTESALAYGKTADRDQVAIAVRADEDRVRLEFPSPVFDSNFDILELERVKGP